MPGHGERLSRKKEQAIVALMAFPTVEKAAKSIGVAPRTLHAWLALPEFSAAYRAARRRIVEGAISQLQHACRRATCTLIDKLGSGNDGVAVRAALAILDKAFEGVELFELEGRIEALEHARNLRPR